MATETEQYLYQEIRKIKKKLCCITDDIATNGFDGIVENFADLPSATTNNGNIYYVINTTDGSIGNVWYSNGTSWISSLTLFDTRISNLENNVYKVTYYEIVTGTSGTITPPTGATFNSNEFGDSGNSILSKINGSNKPTFQSPFTVGGVVVTANLNTTTGAWTTSGTYVDASVALIYSVNISAEDFSNLNNFYIIESEENVTGTLLTGYSSTTGSISASDTILSAIEKLNGNIAAIPPSTLLGVSNASLTTPNSVYQMSAGIPVHFKSSDVNTLLYLDETNERIGIGTASPLDKFDIAGNLIFHTDNTYDIGASGATRPRTGYFGTSLYSPLIVGGTAVGDGITYKATTGVGTSTVYSHTFTGGNNGATTLMKIRNDGLTQFINKMVLSKTVSTGGTFELIAGVDGGMSEILASYWGSQPDLLIHTYDGGNQLFLHKSGNVTIGSTTSVSKFAVPIAPTASANYGLVSRGSGPFDGATSGFYVGSATGQVDAINLASGSTSDFANWQLAGANRFKVSNAGLVTAVGGGNFGGFVINASGSVSQPGGISWHADGYFINFTNNFGYTFLNYGGSTASSSSYYGYKIQNQTIAQTGTASWTDLVVNRVQSSVGSGEQLLLDLQVGSASKFKVDNVGSTTIKGSLTLNYTAVTTTYSVAATDYTVDATSGTFTMTLPTAVSITGKVYNLHNSGTGIITIATTSSQTIDGNASGVLTLIQYDNLKVQSDGANWIIIN